MQWWKRLLHLKWWIKPSVMNILRCIRISRYPSNRIFKPANIFICHNQVIRCEFKRILYFFAAIIALWNSSASYPFKKETVSLYLWLLIILLNNRWLIQSIIWNDMINGMSCRYFDWWNIILIRTLFKLVITNLLKGPQEKLKMVFAIRSFSSVRLSSSSFRCTT